MLRFVAGSLSLVVVTMVNGGCATAPKTADGRPVPSVAVVNDLEGRRVAASEFAAALQVRALRAQTVLALGRLERLDAAQAIFAALDDEDAAVRAAAAFAAGQLDLAFSVGVAAHDAVAFDVEARLIARLSTEQAPAVRTALIRALGRVARTAGRGVLAAVASDRAAALSALGVSFQRRPGAAGDVVIAARDRGLASRDAAEKTAAAYLAFRLGAGLTLEQFTAVTGADAQARIHLTQALSSTKTAAAVVDAAMPALLEDADWRVRVEGLRALQNHADASIEPVLKALPGFVAHIAEPGVAHVVTEACLTLANIGAPNASRPVVEAAVSALPAGNTWAHARCTCAGVVEVLGGADDTLEQCTSTMSPVQQRLLAVQTIGVQRFSSIERATALKSYTNNELPKVRIAAVHALCTDGNVAAVDAAATRLLKEVDPGVLSALLECFVDGRNADILKDGTLAVVTERVIADFVTQGGDPRGDGSGGPGYTIADEPSDFSFVRGTVGIAHAGKDTGGSQFFLTHSDQPHLDGRYTVLGTVIDGLPAMDALQPDDVLLSVEVATALRPRR